jgi:hypothetical protein
MKNLLLFLLLLTAQISYTQSQTQPESKQCKAATNAADALSNYDWFNERIDTAKAKQDSMMDVYEERIRKVKEKFKSTNPE